MIHKRFSVKKFWLFSIALLLLCLPVLPIYNTPKADALSGSEFSAGNIISDSIFFNNSAMNSTQVQNFLNSKVPSCDTNGSKMYNSSQTRAQYGASQGYPAPYTCLKSYSQNTPSMAGETGLCNPYGGGHKSSAQIIVDISNACGVNPQVILVLLQKEQSLVTDEWPWTKQYNKATGFACPDTPQGCDPAYAGFFYQVYSAARQFKKYARDADNYNYRAGRNNNIYWQADNPNTPQNEREQCGFGSVYIQNQATAGLYVYTPYQPNQAALNNLYGSGDACSAYGNRNFWRMFNDWFGSTQGSALVRTPDNGTVYLMTGGKRYGIPSGDILYAYGLEATRVDVVSQSYLNSIEDGGVLGTLFTVPGDPTTYLADSGKKHGIASGEYCTRWGLACGNSTHQKVIGNEIFDRLGEGGMLQPIMRHQGNYYLMENGQKKQFLTTQALAERGFSTNSATTVGNWTNAIRTFGQSLPQTNSFVKFASGSSIYYYDGGNFFTIPDFQTYLNWFSGSGVSVLDSTSSYNSSPPNITASLSNIVQSGSNKYLVDDGRRIDLTAVSSQWPSGMNGANLPSFSSAFAPKATASAGSTFRTSDGTIFKVESQFKRPYNSVYDYLKLTGGVGTLHLNANILPMAQGKVLLGEGSAFKIAGGDTIYVVGQGEKTYAFTSVKQLYDFYPNLAIPTLSSSDVSQFTYQGSLPDTVRSTGALYAVYDGRKYAISSTAQSNWGFTMPSTAIFTDEFLNRIPNGSAVDKFLSSPQGTIFTHGSGSKRPIGSFDRYKNLGGNSSNTLRVSPSTLDALPNGSPVN